MAPKATLATLGLATLFSGAGFRQYAPVSNPPLSRDSQFVYPEHYREWVYLSTGFDMSYKPGAQGGQHTFDNVFVNPEAYKAFVATGSWPDKTTLVLEVRRAEEKGSINQRGNFQGIEVAGLEVHAKDEKRFPGKWAFITFDGNRIGKLIPTSADCYSCHAEHGAVDTTFVQFYPTLLPVAAHKGTLAESYQK